MIPAKTENITSQAQKAAFFTCDNLTAASSDYFLQYNRPSILFRNLAAEDSLSDITANNIYLLINSSYNNTMDKGVKEQTESSLQQRYNWLSAMDLFIYTQ